MSHFSVLVVTDQEPTDDVLSMALQPFHEFECTGVDDEFVKDIDITGHRREEYVESTLRRFKAPDGGLHDPYDDLFYREWTDEEIADRNGVTPMGSGSDRGISYTSKDWGDGLGYRSKAHFVPAGWEDVKVPASEVMSFRDWLEDWHSIKIVRPGEQPDLRDSEKHKYGYAVVDEAGAVVKIIDRTNPNAKWDWWVVGGRYGGRLEPGYDPEKDERNYKAAHETWQSLPEPRPRGAEFDEWLRTQPYGEAAAAYHRADFWGEIKPADGQSIEEWIEATPALSAFAVVKDGEWFEKGKMGWWACVSDEKPDWAEQFDKLLSGLRVDQWVTFVDCHI